MFVPRVLVVLPLVFALACSGGGETPAPPGAEATSVQEQPGGPASEGVSTARPAADIDGECEPTPQETEDGRYELGADITVVNTGNLGVKVRVAAAWPQPKGRGLTRYQRISLDEGESRELRLRLVVGGNEAGAINKAMGNGRQCRLSHRVVGAFGAPSN